MMMNKHETKESGLPENLEVVIATTFALYVKTHSFHFNVEGPNFKALHILFGEIYENLFSYVDILAEDLRTLDECVPFCMTEMLKLSAIKEQHGAPSDGKMVQELHHDLETFEKVLTNAFKVANKDMNQGIANHLADVLSDMAKWKWQLHATLK